MRRVVFFALALIVCLIGSIHADTDTPFLPWFKAPREDRRVEKMGQSFMFPRPVYQNIAAQQSSFWHDAVYEKFGLFLHSMQIVPLYQKSYGSGAQARYFLINHHNTLVVKGDDVRGASPFTDLSDTGRVRDVRAEWIGLPGDFLGTFSLLPEQKQAGVWIEFNQDLKKLLNIEMLSTLWLGFACVFQHVENNLNVGQTRISTEPPTFPKTTIEAFNRTTMCYGKIPPGNRKKNAFAELFFKLGSNFMARDGFQIGAYSILMFPTYGHQNPEFMFDPMIGHNRFFGLGTGVNFQLPLNRDIECQLISLFFNIENLFYLRNFQKRSFDLRLKPWSRYMLLNGQDGQKNIPAINILTRKAKVQPFNFMDMSIGFRFQKSSVEFEIGYNLWAHGDEQLTLKKPFPKDKYGIAAAPGIVLPGTNIGATASKSTIQIQAEPDRDIFGELVFIPITERDLDMLSAAARACVAHRAHIAFGYVYDQESVAFYGGFGGFIEIPQRNTGLSNGGAWAKLGATL